MRLVFAGTPAAAVPSLRGLAAAGHEIALVVTRPDAPIGRRRILTPSAVGDAAEQLGIPTLKTRRLDEDAAAAIAAAEPALGVIVAYGGLVREPLLSAPPRGWINLHFSLLPRWRGAAPVQRALMAGDSETGASVFQLVPELDAGDVFDERRYRVPDHATAGDVLDDLSVLGADLLSDVVASIATGTARARPQEGEVTFAGKLTIADGELDFTGPAAEVLARWRGTTPEPGAFTTVAGSRLKVHSARQGPLDVIVDPGLIVSHDRQVLVGTATAPIVLERVQPAGKAEMPAADWWRGQRLDSARAGT